MPRWAASLHPPSGSARHACAQPHEQPPLTPIACGSPAAQTLVLDLDETLVHSSFRPVPNPDYVIPVEIDGKVRPGPPGGTCTSARHAWMVLCGTPPWWASWAGVGVVCGVSLPRAPPPPLTTLLCVAQITDVYVLKRPWVDHFLVRPGAGPDVAVPGEHRES